MTTYTQAEPFEFEGVKVWRKKHKPSVLCVRDAFEFSPTFYMESSVVKAITAMLEAERHPATWTEQEDGSWRKGPWVAVRNANWKNQWAVMHDDFPNSRWAEGASGGASSAAASALVILADFLTFYAAHTKPEILPDPEVGEHIWLERRDGQVFVGVVASVAPSHYVMLEGSPHQGHWGPSKEGALLGQIIAWGLIEPEFTPLPVPDVGQWGEFTLRDGTVVRDQVTGVEGTTLRRLFFKVSHAAYLPSEPMQDGVEVSNDIIAWHPIDPPQPEEPTGFGAVVNVGGWRYVRVPGVRPSEWLWIRAGEFGISWDALVTRGPVTIESRGVEK